MSALAAPSRFPAPWRVRPMRLRDLPLVFSMEREIYPFPWTEGNFHDAIQAGYEGWMLEDNDRLIAYALCMWVLDELHLLNLGVGAPDQGRGVGRCLLQWLCADAAGRGASAMFLEVRPSNERALALYRSSGFETVGLRRRYYPSYNGTREDAWVMRRSFSASVPGEPPRWGDAQA